MSFSSLAARARLPRTTAAAFPFTVSANLHSHLPARPNPSGKAQLSKSHIPLAFCTSAEDAKQSKIGTSSENEGLPAGLRRETIPGHVALILDGNKRWAEQRGMESHSGHDAGLHALVRVMGLCAKWGIKVATFFLFSSENWRRPAAEIDFVMWRFQKMLVDELDNLIRQGIRMSTIGDTALLSDSLQQVLEYTKEAAQNNTRTHVVFAVSYSGQDDITKACQSIAMKVKDELETKITATPCPDSLIRTSGEVRISNLLLWQLAYSELYFTNTLWPDFAEPEFTEALQSFQQRRRRFGGR
ncbi:hypothetical protein Cgig2_003987 [Carnegiea gigantea]|uniref:Alkyl transferase n=1 Tax=Carnegiea gigantea TaxID=171969 RepID=A0A9Q1QFR3_9CARY|nr:hypothetical protein Cgig2_003987 [Carnegiea gigantea]